MRNTAPTDAAELEALETREWLESLDYVLQHGGPARVGRLLRELGIHAQKTRRQAAVHREHALHQHHPRRRTGALSGQPRDRAPHQEPGPLERDGDGRRAPTASKTASAATSRPSPRRPRSTKSASTTSSAAATTATKATSSTSRATRSPGIYARAFLEGRLSQRAARELPPRAAAGRRAVVLSAPVADARLLGVPDGVDGPRADHGDLPGALQPLPRRSRPQAGDRRQGLGVSRRRRDRRARVARRHHAGLAREARQPDLRRSTATCSGSTARCAATARSSRSSKRSSAAPAGT